MFKFGKQKPNIKQYAITGIVLSCLISSLSYCTHIPEHNIWDLVDEVQRRYFPQTIINDYIIKDPPKLERRIRRDVDRAIENILLEYNRIIERETNKYRPKYVKEMNDETVCHSDECKALAPPMRICSPWVDSCERG